MDLARDNSDAATAPHLCFMLSSFSFNDQHHCNISVRNALHLLVDHLADNRLSATNPATPGTPATPATPTTLAIMATPKDTASMWTLGVGSRVSAKFRWYRGGKKWYPGTITEVHEKGSFTVFFDDGDTDEKITPKNIKPLGETVQPPQRTRPFRKKSFDPQATAEHEMVTVFMDYPDNDADKTTEPCNNVLAEEIQTPAVQSQKRKRKLQQRGASRTKRGKAHAR